MAITAEELNTALGHDGNPRMPHVLRELPPYGGATQYWHIHGGSKYFGRTRRFGRTASQDAATQAAACLVALETGVAP